MQLHKAHPPLCTCACSASHFLSVRTRLLPPAAKEPVERPKAVFLFAVFHCCIHQYDLKHNESSFRSLASCSFFVLLFILFCWNYFPFSLVIYPVLPSRCFWQSCHLVPFHCLWWLELCSHHCLSDCWPSPLAVGLLKRGMRGFCSWCTFASAQRPGFQLFCLAPLQVAKPRCLRPGAYIVNLHLQESQQASLFCALYSVGIIHVSNLKYLHTLH